MKKWLIIFIFLIALPLISAIETNLKQEYKPGETLILEISGINQLKASDVLFYSGRAFIPMVYDVGKIKDKFYLYSLLPDKERNYTLIIDNSKFDFSVHGNTTSFSVNPGFIITNKDFKIKIKTFKSTTIKSEFLDKTEEFSLTQNKEKILLFSVSDINNFTTTNLILSDDKTKYEIPVAIFKETTPQIESSPELRFSKSFFNFTVLKDKEFIFPLTIINTGQENIENISFSTDLKMIILPKTIVLIEAGSSKEISVIINSSEEGIIEGSIITYSKKNSYEITLSIITTQSEEEFQDFIEISEIIEKQTCEEMQGDVCEDNEECIGEEKFAANNIKCCVGECKKESTFGLGKTTALIIIILVLLIIVFFILKKLKTRKKFYSEILREKERSYEERFKPKEIRGSLER